MVDIKLKCECLSGDAKWNLKGVLNTAQLLAQNNINRLNDQISQLGKEGKEVPHFMEMAIEHLRSDLAIVKELKEKVDAIDVCG